MKKSYFQSLSFRVTFWVSLTVVESLRLDHPDLKIVVSYLAPSPGGDWKDRVSGLADVVDCKPYSVLDIDRSLRETGGDTRVNRN